MEEKRTEHRAKRGKKLCIAVGAVLLFAAAGAGALWYWHMEKGNEKPEMPFDREAQAGIVTAAGTTAAGIVEKELSFDFLDADLIVDEVYVSSSDAVEAGTKLLKITDGSLKEARRELERASMEAELAYRQGKIDYETQKIEARNTYDKSLAAAQYAEAIYNDALAQADAEVEKLLQEAADAEELLQEYRDAIDNNYYYTEYEVEEKKAAYEKNLELFLEKLDDYGYEMDDDDDDDPNTYNIVKKGSSGSQPSGDDKSGDGESTVLNLLKSEYQENKEEYDQALKDYEADTAKARAGIAEAEDQAALCALKLQEAQIENEKAKNSALADMETAQVTAEKAGDTYQTALNRLEEELALLLDEKDETAENLELFENTVGDGYIYAEKTGNLLMMHAMENSALQKEGVLLAYSDAGTITVTASVDQADISAVSLGGKAVVRMEGYDDYTGIVTEINPVSQSSSRANVTYSVVLKLQGDVSELSSNITASVFFGDGLEKLENTQEAPGKAPGNSGPEGETEEGGKEGYGK